MTLSRILAKVIGDPSDRSLRHRLLTASALCSSLISLGILPEIFRVFGDRAPSFLSLGYSFGFCAIYALALKGWRSPILVWLYLGLNALVLFVDWTVFYGDAGIALPITVALMAIAPLIVPGKGRLVGLSAYWLFLGVILYSGVYSPAELGAAGLPPVPVGSRVFATLLLGAGMAAMTGLFMAAYRQQEERFQRLRRTEARERLESLGRMAGGIAHDLNNIFNVISIAAEEGSRACGDEGVQAFLKPLRSSAQRGTEMVGRLMNYSRSVPTEPLPVDLGVRMEENLDFFRRAAGRGCLLELRGQKVRSRVLIDPVGFDQVVLNLVVNASQAMADGGRILLDLRTEALATPRTVGIEQVRPGFWQVLSVTDQGPGIDPGEAERIFEPFYTTRAGTGTGLGLATVLSVVQEAGGAVEVAPGPEGGTRFSCWFPLLTEEEAAFLSRESKSDLPAGGPKAAGETFVRGGSL